MRHNRRMTSQQLIDAALDPSVNLIAQGIDADPWQRDIHFCKDQQALMNCCRHFSAAGTNK